MNASIRAAVRYGISCGMEVMGVERGYSGLIDGAFVEMGLRSVSDIIQRGGTILRTARCPEFKTPEGRAKGIENLRRHGVEGLIVIGGDGSFMGAKILSELGFPTIGIPGTIDNDLAYTDYTLGFDTACNTILDAINKIRDTMSSHERISIVEVMGRNCGLIALYAAVASGAVAVAVPELPFDETACLKKIRALRDNPTGHKRSMIVVVSEGMPAVNGQNYGEYLRARIQKETGVESKYAQFAHVVRGGKPSLKDRFIASEMGVRAVELRGCRR